MMSLMGGVLPLGAVMRVFRPRLFCVAAVALTLAGDRGRWTVLRYQQVVEPEARQTEAAARRRYADGHSVSPSAFGRQVRLVRNSGAWVAPIEDVGRYLLQYRQARLDLRPAGHSARLRIEDTRADGLPPVPMTVVLDLPWRWVAVTGSAADGVYSPYSGRLTLPVLPGREVLLSRLAGTDPR